MVCQLDSDDNRVFCVVFQVCINLVYLIYILNFSLFASNLPIIPTTQQKYRPIYLHSNLGHKNNYKVFAYTVHDEVLQDTTFWAGLIRWSLKCTVTYLFIDKRVCLSLFFLGWGHTVSTPGPQSFELYVLFSF